MAKKIVVIDAGHGGEDAGATANGLKEKDLTLDIAKRIQKGLNKYDVKVIMTRTTDVFLTLTERTVIANKAEADAFVSVHINAGRGTGFETYIYNGNVSDKTHTLQSNVHSNVMKQIDVSNRGKKRANFAVVRQTKMPAILTENLFIDSNDADKLKDSKVLDKLAQGHVDGIVKYLGLADVGEASSTKKSKPSKPKTKAKTTKKTTGKVATIQDWVNKTYGYRIAVDNIPGPETNKHLLMAYQTELNKQFNAGLKVDGIWGPKTATASVTVRKGAKGNLTRILQSMLVVHGLNIAVDGIFGNDTEKAVKSFQKSAKIGVDGVPGKTTFTKLFA